ncbi:MAG: tetratricopeptide repeat protein [Betaproteobacteria bacterium]
MATARRGDPGRVVTKRDFARELSELREDAGVTVRQVASAVRAASSTVGGYFSGKHLPAPRPADLLDRILAACGVVDAAEVDRWRQALRRARRGTGELASPSTEGDDPPSAPGRVPRPREAEPGNRAALVSTRPPVHRLAREPTARGRDAVLASLERSLRQLGADPVDPPPEQVYVLHGLGGCGKSTTALLLARRAVELGIQVWWISAADPGNLLAGMQALAVELGAGRDQIRLGSSPDLVAALLAAHPRPWLLVIDNADDPAGVLALPGGDVTDGTGWIRPVHSGRGMIVVTTSDGSAATWGEPAAPWLRLVDIPTLDPADGARVLTELAGAGAGDEAHAAQLSQRLGGLPLALGLAGRYLAEAGTVPPALAGADDVRTFADYARALDQGRHRELRAAVGRTWELSLDLLAARGMPLARPLLRLLSLLGPAPVPGGLLLRPGILSASALFGPLTGRALWELLRCLDGLGVVRLVRTDAGDPDLADEVMPHPLVRDTSRHGADVRTDIETYVRLVTALIVDASAALDPRDPHDWPRWRALAEHSHSPLDLIAEFRLRSSAVALDVITGATPCARYLRASGQLSRAEALYRRLVKVGVAAFGPREPAVLEAQHELSRVWYDLGRLGDAIRGFRAVVRARSETLGTDDPRTLTSQHYLARTLRDAGQVNEAFRLFRRTWDSRRTSLGDDHPDTWTSRNNVGDALRSLGRFDQAEIELRDVLRRRTAALGAEHPATLVTRYHLARLARDRGELAAARAQLTALAETSRRVLGDDHPRTLTAEQALIDVWHDAGDDQAAERSVRVLLARRRAVLGDQHPATLLTQHRLGLVLIDRGDLRAAEAELAAVLLARRLVLGPTHADTVATRESLDALRRRQVR